MRESALRVLWVAALLMVAAAPPGRAQTSVPNPLPTVKRLKCDFQVSSAAIWENGEPTAQIRKSGVLSIQFTEIDTMESTANAVGLASTGHIVAQLSGWNLHFLDIRPTGSLTVTTVFAQESRDKKLKAVHTRTDYLPVAIPGFVARPDVFQYYGECEILQ
jgi:hypothetical protein